MPFIYSPCLITSLSFIITTIRRHATLQLVISMLSAIVARKSSLHATKTDMDQYATKLLILFTLIALGSCELSRSSDGKALANTSDARQPTILNQHSSIKNSEHSDKSKSDMEEFENVLSEYVEDVLNRKKINIGPGVYIQKIAKSKSEHKIEKKSFDENLIWTVKDFAETHALRVDLARAMTETGRLFFFKGKWHNLWSSWEGNSIKLLENFAFEQTKF